MIKRRKNFANRPSQSHMEYVINSNGEKVRNIAYNKNSKQQINQKKPHVSLDFYHDDEYDDSETTNDREDREVVDINTIMDINKLNDYIEKKYVTAREHPDNPNIVIINYTNRAMYSRVWDEVTMNARGLIFNRETNEVLARPWKKFFNHNQPEAPSFDSFGEVEVTDKMDGSLIIGYRMNDELRLSTKGSFDSEMSTVAEDIMKSHTQNFDDDITPLFEVIYPQNQIVVDYGDTRDLFLLGGVSMSTGEYIGAYDARLESYDGPRTKVFTMNTLGEALHMPPRDGAEGVVVRDVNNGNMMKIKQEDYIELHRVVTQVTGLTIWRALSSGNVDDIIDRCPDELFNEVDAVMNNYKQKYQDIMDNYKNTAEDIADRFDFNLGDELSPEMKRDVSIYMSNNLPKNDFANIMSFITGSNNSDRYKQRIWRMIRPHGEEAEKIGTFMK